jgi:hypothetical protein
MLPCRTGGSATRLSATDAGERTAAGDDPSVRLICNLAAAEGADLCDALYCGFVRGAQGEAGC